jgi:GT2 family glycosyltransferase
MAEDLTVLIANLGRLEHLLPCLHSLFATVGGNISFRVIVGFNFQGNNDSQRRLREEFPAVEQLRAPNKLGYCRAYNQLMSRSRSRYTLLLDDDTILHPGALEGMVRYMDDNPNVGIAGCRTINQDGSYQKTTARMFTLGTELINVFRPGAFWRDGIDESVATSQSVAWLNGHFLFVRTKVIEQVGALDEYFYTFQCEADWCLRIRRAGWKVAYVPDFQVMHVRGAHSSAPGVKSYSSLIRFHINRYYFMRKHYGNGSQRKFRVIMSAGSMLRMWTYMAIWLLSPERRPEAVPKVKAYWKTVLMGVSRRPDGLPDELRRENDVFEVFQPGMPG